MEQTRRALMSSVAASRWALAQGDARAWVPARKKYGPPVTHVVSGETAGVRTLRNVQWPGLAPVGDSSGPSTPPSLQSNAWLAQWERYRAPGVPLWLAPVRPAGRAVTAEECLVALADCEASGARWVIDCDDGAFPRVAEAVRFFDAHRDWRNFVAPRQVGMVASAQPEMREVMSRMCQLTIPFRLVAAPLPGMSALIVFGAPDRAAQEFANTGGLVITLGWKAMNDRATGDVAWVETRPHTRTGAGYVAAWRGPVADAQRFVRDLRVRLSPDNLAVKLHNGPGSMVRFTVSDDDGRGLLQVIHYGGRVWEEEITVWAQYLASKAVLHQWGAKPRVMETGRRDGGTEIVLSRLDTYAAVDFFPL